MQILLADCLLPPACLRGGPAGQEQGILSKLRDFPCLAKGPVELLETSCAQCELRCALEAPVPRIRVARFIEVDASDDQRSASRDSITRGEQVMRTLEVNEIEFFNEVGARLLSRESTEWDRGEYAIGANVDLPDPCANWTTPVSSSMRTKLVLELINA